MKLLRLFAFLDGTHVIRVSYVLSVRSRDGEENGNAHRWESRTCFAKCGNAHEDDRCWYEHRSIELLSWNLRSKWWFSLETSIDMLVSLQYHQTSIENVRTAEKLTQAKGHMRAIGIALDTKGPEIRTGVLADVSALDWSANMKILSINMFGRASIVNWICKMALLFAWPLMKLSRINAPKRIYTWITKTS